MSGASDVLQFFGIACPRSHQVASSFVHTLPLYALNIEPLHGWCHQSGWSGFHLITFNEQYMYSKNSI